MKNGNFVATMSFEFHKDRDKYFNLQKANTTKYIIPFIEKVQPVTPELKVLEVGCRDGGVLRPFLELGCHITGVELAEEMLNQAKERYKEEIEAGKATFIAKNIHDFSSDQQFDIIILKDVIEHVYEHEKLVAKLRELLTDKGIIYFGYPPWHNPYGGHQQVAEHKLLSKIPYYHILPNFIYYGMLKLGKEEKFGFLKATKETRITIEKFRRLMRECDLKIRLEEHYLINPMYEAKFGWKPRRQKKIIQAIPYIRNYFTTTCDVIVSK